MHFDKKWHYIRLNPTRHLQVRSRSRLHAAFDQTDVALHGNDNKNVAKQKWEE